MDNNITTAHNFYIEMRPITELKSTSVGYKSNKQLCKYYCDICETQGFKTPNNFKKNMEKFSEDDLSSILDNKPQELKNLLDTYDKGEGDVDINLVISDSLAIFNEQLLEPSYFNTSQTRDYNTKINQIFDKLKKVPSPIEMRPITELKSTSVGYKSNKQLCKYYCDICETQGFKTPEHFSRNIQTFSEDDLSSILDNKPQKLKQLLDMYYEADKHSKIDIFLRIEVCLNLFAKRLSQPDEYRLEYTKQIDLNMANLGIEILKININNNKPISPELVAFVKLGQPSITQTEKGTVINQGNLGTCRTLMMIMVCSNYKQLIMPIAEDNNTTKGVDLYLPNSTLKLNESDLTTLQNHGITCHVNQAGVVYKMTITAETYEKIKQQHSATSNNKSYNSMLKILEWLIVNESEVFGDLGTYNQETKVAALLGLKILYNSTLERGPHINISFIKDLVTKDALQIMSPAHPALISPNIQIGCGLKFNVDNANDPGNHAVLFKKILIREGVHWVKYLNPWGEVEYITLNQWVKQLADTGVSVFAPEDTEIDAKSLKQPLHVNRRVLLEDSKLGKSGMDLNQGLLLNNGNLVAGKARCLGLTFHNGKLLTGFDPDSGVFYMKGKKYQPEIVKLAGTVYIKTNGQLQKLNKKILGADYYVDGQKVSVEYKHGKMLIGDKPFSGFDNKTNILYKGGHRYTGLVQIEFRVFKYVVGFQDHEVTTLLTEDENKTLYKVNPNVKINI